MMRRMRRGWVLCSILGASLVAATAEATPSRMGALLGNKLFEDDTDSNLLPAVTGRYGSSAFLNLAGAGNLQAGLVYGSTWLVGASYGTPVAYEDLAQIDAELNRTLLLPSRLLSVQLVRRLDDTSAVGFALNPSFGIVRSFPPSPGVIANTMALDVELIAGYSSSTDTATTDVALALSYHRFQDRSDGITLSETENTPSAALRGRTFLKGIFASGDLGLYGELARRDESFVQHEPFTSRANLARWVLVAGAGPRFRPAEWATIAAALEVNYTLLAGGVDQSALLFSQAALPSLQVAAEVSPLSWLIIRAAVARQLVIASAKPSTGGQADVTLTAFNWATGAGVRWHRLELDATISSNLLLNGPSFIGGGAPGLFGSLSVRYPFQ